jgi:hypothetical protein
LPSRTGRCVLHVIVLLRLIRRAGYKFSCMHVPTTCAKWRCYWNKWILINKN